MKTGNYKIRNAYDVTIEGRWTIGFWNADKQQWFQSHDHSIPLKVIEIGCPATFYKFLLICKNGSSWGKTGQRALMCCEGKTKEKAEIELKNHIPGGWIYKFIGETKQTYYLKHL